MDSGLAPSVYRFAGTLAASASGSFCSHPFDVPEGTGSLRLRLEYAPYSAGPYINLLTLGLFDPSGLFRGQAHRGPADPQVLLRPSSASPGFIPGPVPAGRWLAQVAVHLVLPTAAPCRYSLEIEPLPEREVAASAPWRPPRREIANPRPSWYRGEAHAHTTHSDASWTVGELLAQARANGLDFVALTDHNTTSAWGEIESTAQGGLLVIPGVELTTFHGHAVALGVERWIDWRTGWQGWTIDDAARATHAAGGLFVVAHPCRDGAPACTGCDWDYRDLDPALVDGLEVWSGPWLRGEDHNPCDLRLWHRLAAEGHHPTAMASCDAHGPGDWRAGVPFTWVYAEELSVPGILAGLRQGRVMLSCGPWLQLEALPATPRGPAGTAEVSLRAAWRDAPPRSRLAWLCNGELLGEQPVWGEGEALLGAPPPGGRFHAELWDAGGSLLALTNGVTVMRDA